MIKQVIDDETNSSIKRGFNRSISMAANYALLNVLSFRNRIDS